MVSKGQELLHNIGVKQAVCIPASCFCDEIRLRWSDSFSKKNNRKLSKIPNTSMLLVISQNCDIAAANDNLESSLELVVCKKLKPRDLHAGNQFAHSCRRLQFECEGQWYEANVDYILTVDKGDLLECIEKTESFRIINLDKEYGLTVPVWRANRYLRIGLPDSFNKCFIPILNTHIAKIENASKNDAEQLSEIKAIYIGVDPNDESESHTFQVFALLRHLVSDGQMVAISDAIEELATDLSEQSGFTDVSHVYADRESNTYVSFLSNLLRLNLDYISLAQGDDDF